MKLCVASHEYPTWPKMEWVVQAAKALGHDVMRATHSSRLPEAFSTCDLVILGHKSLAGRWPNVRVAIENRSCPAIYWWFDLIATDRSASLIDQPLFQQHERMFHACDLSFVKERGLLADYRDAGVCVEYLDQGITSRYPSVEYPDEPQFDLLVWGNSNAFYRQRLDDVKRVVSAGFKVAWATTQPTPNGCERLPWTHPDELPALASQARCVLSCGLRNDIDGYWSDQFWMATGMGACVLRRQTPGLPDGPYLTYTDSDHLCDMVRWARSNPDHAIELGKECRSWAMTNHTVEKRLEDLLQHVARIAPMATRPS